MTSMDPGRVGGDSSAQTFGQGREFVGQSISLAENFNEDDLENLDRCVRGGHLD